MSCRVTTHSIYSATHCNSITTQLQLNKKKSFKTIMQLHYNYTHDVMMTSLIIIHLLKSNTRHYEDFWT